MAARRKKAPRTPLPARAEFDGDDLMWFDAVQTALITRGETDLAFDLFPLLPDEMEQRLNNYSKENT